MGITKVLDTTLKNLTDLSTRANTLKEKATQEINKLKDQRDMQLRDLRNAWDSRILVEIKELEEAIGTIEPQMHILSVQSKVIKDKIHIARTHYMGDTYSRVSLNKGESIIKEIPLNFFRVYISIDPPNYRRKKYEMKCIADAGRLQDIAKKNIEDIHTWNGIYYIKRFDTKAEIESYLEKNLDKLTNKIKVVDEQFLSIAQHPDYLTAASKHFDMREVWQEWSGEQTLSVTRNTVQFSFDDLEVKVSYLRDKTFQIKVIKGKLPKNEEVLLKEKIESHLDHGIYYTVDPTLIIE